MPLHIFLQTLFHPARLCLFSPSLPPFYSLSLSSSLMPSIDSLCFPFPRGDLRKSHCCLTHRPPSHNVTFFVANGASDSSHCCSDSSAAPSRHLKRPSWALPPQQWCSHETQATLNQQFTHKSMDACNNMEKTLLLIRMRAFVSSVVM